MSRERKSLVRRQHPRVQSRTVKCFNCGKEFHPFGGKTPKFCSYKCMGESQRKEPVQKKCQTCGQEFVPWRSTAKYCSHKCAGIGITALNKDKYNPKEWERRKAGGKNNHLDNLWRFAIYRRAGYVCEYCGATGQLNAHHIFSRSNFAVRWDIENGVCLCVSHHIFGNLSFHKSPAEMLEWIKEKRGMEWYERLLKKARTMIKTSESKERAYEILKNEQYDRSTIKRIGGNDE